jgi:hypothetical protein
MDQISISVTARGERMTFSRGTLSTKDVEDARQFLSELEPLDPAAGTTEPAAGDTARSA